MPKSCASLGSSATARTVAPSRVRFSTNQSRPNSGRVTARISTSCQENQSSPKRMLPSAGGSEALGIAAEDAGGAALQDVAEAQGDDHQAGEVLLHHQPQHHALQRDAEQPEHEHGDRHGDE